MKITELRVEGYRSIRALRLPFGQVNVIVGANGVGKSNLYRSVLLLAAAARGELARALAAEGGMPSVLWAGPRKGRPKPVRMRLGLTLEGRQGELTYDLAAGLPGPVARVGPYDPLRPPDNEVEPTRFPRDPEVKEETVGVPQHGGRPALLLERKNHSAWLRDGEGRRVAYPLALAHSESVVSQLQDPHRYPELSVVSELFRQWRFYHQFRTDPDAPMKQPRVATRAFVLDEDGANLVAALQTIRENGDAGALAAALQRGLPQVERLDIPPQDHDRLQLFIKVSGMQRPVEVQELSDGTLRYLCLCAALLTPRPPLLLALNEPETSLHPDLIEPLADLCAHAARRAQLWITTHSRALAEGIAQRTGERPIELAMEGGETRVVGREQAELDW